MFTLIKKFFGFGNSTAPEVTAPYKVPEPATTASIPSVVEVAPVVQAATQVKARPPRKPKAAAITAPAKSPAKPKKPNISIAK